MQLDLATIIEAIKKRKLLKVTYPPGERLLEPHTLGYGSQQQILLRGYQTSGASASEEPVNWKLLRVDRVKEIELTPLSFQGPRPGYTVGDSAMKGGIIEEL